MNELGYRDNVANEKAVVFYERHGAKVQEPAYKRGREAGEVELMRYKHCIRYALGLCPKEAAKRGERVKPLPLVLTSGAIELTARFHCKPCEMSLWGSRKAPASCHKEACGQRQKSSRATIAHSARAARFREKRAMTFLKT